MTSTRIPALGTYATVLVLAVTSVLLTAGPSPRDGQARPWNDVFVVAGIVTVAAVLAFGVLLPMARSSARRAGALSVTTAVVALVGLPVLLWSGTSMLLGVAAVLLAGAAGDQNRSTAARAGRALGLLAVAVNATIMVVLVLADFRPALPV